MVEAWKVLLKRRNIIRQRNEKEWWFSYCFDHTFLFYLSWAFVRSCYSDYFSIFALDTKSNEKWMFHKNLLLDRVPEKGPQRLEKRSHDFAVRFGEEDDARRFRLTTGPWEIDLMIGESPFSPFVKRENQFLRHYLVAHTYKNPVEGTVAINGRRYALRTDHTYFDHCFGNVPRRTGWHWIAVQNRDTALTSLVNYGPYAQRYTQVLNAGRWLRLGQDVTFEYDSARPQEPWRVTSPDMDLTVEILGHAATITRIPALVPVLVNINHTEFVVKAFGRVHIDGAWREQRDLIGVMEEHRGRW
jgi:hypothetical protein